jgi:arylformamidase
VRVSPTNVSDRPVQLLVEIAGRRWRAATTGHDLSLPLAFDGEQPTFFGAAAATARPLVAGSFKGDVREGSSCNCASYSLTPHCNGTHTECVGHITSERVSVRDIAAHGPTPAMLVTVSATPAESTTESTDPAPQAGDMVITQRALQDSLGDRNLAGLGGLVVRTRPNDQSKRRRNYDRAPLAPYFTAQAMRWMVECGVHTLVVDLPSLDRADDGGRLTAHRLYWGLEPGATSAATATRGHATVTELAYVDDAICDGLYLLNLQVAPFVADAAPSRPILLPLSPS